MFEDLRPYICTFKGCDTKLFNDRRVWFEHEMQNHRVTYQCRLCSHRPYTSEDQLQQHLLARHQELCQPNTLVAMLKASQNSQESFPASSCPCCHDWETKLRPSNRHIRTEDPIMVTGKQFRNHLASHQEQLALFALPKQYNEDGEDFKSAGVVAGGSAANLSDASDLSIASSSHRIEDKTGKLFKKLVELLNAQESSDNYTLNSVVKSLLVDTQNADEIFRIVLLSSHPLREELIKITIKHGANTNQSFEGRSSLCIACATQNLDLLCTLLEAGSAISSRHGLAPSALHLAATIGWIDGCLELVRYGADLNSASDMDDNRPIHAAVQIPNESILELLLASGADINVTNRAGRTALHIAVKHRNTSSIRLLLQHGIDVNRKDQNLRTALHDAAATGQRATVNLLLSVAARTNTIDLWDNCPLTSASMVSMEYSSNCKAIVESLLNNGASIQLWSTGIPVTTLRVRLDGLTKLQQILEELGSPIAIDAQNHIVEANCTAFGAIQPSRGHIVSGSDHTEASTTDPERTISNPESSHWRDAELRQLDILHQRREQFGIDKEFLDGLEMLGKLYQEWIDACYPENKTPSNPETRVIISQILDRMHRLTIDLWMNNRQEAAEDLMVEIIRNYSSAIKESSTISKYNVITAIAAAIRTFSPQEHLWKRALRDSDWREAIRIRDTTTKQPASALPSGCARCAGIVFWNDTIYNLHLTWHDNEQRNVDVLEPSPSHHRWVSRSKSEPKRSLYTGLMVYGIMNLDWQSAGDDELSAKKGESIAILARSNHEWLIAKSFDQPGEPGLLPLSALRIFSMETDWHPLDPSAIEAASIPNVSEWKKLDRLLKSRSAIRSSEVS